jgi:hypothetical protein
MDFEEANLKKIKVKVTTLQILLIMIITQIYTESFNNNNEINE